MLTKEKKPYLCTDWHYSALRSLFAGKTSLLARLSLIVALIFNQFTCLSPRALSQSTPNSQLPLVQASNLSYIGGFRLPNGQVGDRDGNDTFNFSGGSIAFNPADNGMFVACHVYTAGAVAEVTIPPLVNSTKVTDLNTATVKQKASGDLLHQLTYNDTGDPLDTMGGLIVINGQIIFTGYVYYDAVNGAKASHCYTSNTDLASMQVVGACNVQNTAGGPGFVGGHMCAVPSNWQSALGGAPYITGLLAPNIINRTSNGPCAFGFDPAKLSVSKPSTSIAYLYYPISNETLGGYGTSPPTCAAVPYGWNGTAQGSIGAVFVPGTRSILFFGRIGTGPFCYGDPNANGGTNPEGTINNDGAVNCNDPCTGGKGPHSVGGAFQYRVWAYDANDFVSVYNGQKKTWEILPYSTWQLPLPPYGDCGCPPNAGVTFDSASGTIYFCQLGADTVAQYSYLPVIQGFKITGLSSSSPSPSPSPSSPIPVPKESPAQKQAAAKAAEEKLKQREAALRAAEEATKRKAEALKAKEAAAKAAEEKLKQKEAALRAAEEAAKRKAEALKAKEAAAKREAEEKSKQEEEAAKGAKK